VSGTSVGPTPPVRLTDDIRWVHECYDLGDGRHEHVSVYLIEAPAGTIVVDSGSFYHRESLFRRISEATDGRGVQALVLSHSDFPHSANIGRFREAWGDFEIVASCGEPGIQGLPYARPSHIGETLDVLGRSLTFLDPPLADRSHTTWIYDHESRVMFVADGFGNYHAPGACDLLSPALPPEGRVAGIDDFHEDTLTWLRYVDPDLMARVLDRLFEDHPVSWVAPIHGNPIARADLDAYLDVLKAGVRRIAAGYEVPP
jgi:flavorubredoxin